MKSFRLFFSCNVFRLRNVANGLAFYFLLWICLIILFYSHNINIFTCTLDVTLFPIFFFPFFLFFKIFPSKVLTCRTNSLPLFRRPVYIPTQLRLQKRPEAEKSWGRPYFPHTSQHKIWDGSKEFFSLDFRFFLTLSAVLR